MIHHSIVVILPEMAMAYISILSKKCIFVDATNAQYPLMFRISNGHQSSYCGVKEFSAPNGVCYIPRWVLLVYFAPIRRSWRNSTFPLVIGCLWKT